MSVDAPRDGNAAEVPKERLLELLEWEGAGQQQEALRDWIKRLRLAVPNAFTWAQMSKQ